MEENKNNYAFKFEPDKVEKAFKDDKGTSKMTIESDNAPLNMPDNVTLVNRPKTKTRVKMSDIGPRSQGFAGVATLAVIIAVAGIIIAYLTLRY